MFEVHNLSDTEDREVWLDFRRGKIMSSSAKEIRPLSRGADRTPHGLYKLVAENVSVKPDGEKPDARGRRVQDDAIKWLCEKTGKQFVTGIVWTIDTVRGVTPDASAPGDKPTYAAEVKSLNSDNHLEYIYRDILDRREEGYSPINSVPSDYFWQVIHYFVVNPHLETLYFVFHDDRVAYEHLVDWLLVVERKDIMHLIDEQNRYELEALDEAKQIIKVLKEGK